MKTKILSMLLTVAMLVAMVPMFTVGASAEETGTTYEVGSIADVEHFLNPKSEDKCDCTTDTCKYAGGNATNNTMKLTQDLTYEAPEASSISSLWAGLNANVDGNGRTVTLREGTYHKTVLFEIADGTDAENKHAQEIKNLKVVTEGTISAPSGSAGNQFSLFGQVHYKTGSGINFVDLTVENCYFNVTMSCSNADTNTGAGILISRICGHASGKADFSMTVKNSYFKANMSVSTEKEFTSSGALIGRYYTGAPNFTITMNVENCVFDITNNRADTDGNYYAVFGDLDTKDTTAAQAETPIIFSGKNNVIYNGYKAMANSKDDAHLTAFTTVTETDTNTVTTVKGYQTTDVADSEFDLRLVGLVNLAEGDKLENYSKVGFVVVANYANTNTKWTSAASNKVYNSITENTATSTNALTATELGGNYIYALAIKNIPANAGDITFEVTPYYIDADGAKYGATTQFTVDIDIVEDNDDLTDGIPTEDFDIAA